MIYQCCVGDQGLATGVSSSDPTHCLFMYAKGFYIFKELNKKAKEELHFVTFENLNVGART